MTFSIYESLMYVSIALFIGYTIGVGQGWREACHESERLTHLIRMGELIVPHPVKSGAGIIHGASYMTEQVCEASR